MPEIKGDFIKQFPGYNQVILQLLYNRGFIGKFEIENFLNPDYEKCSLDPFLFKDMEKAVELIIKHIKEQNKIVVYGDYDADGVTASAVLTETLTILKTKVDVYIPDRTSEGYGLNKKAIDELVQTKAKLIITVDNGIRNKEEVEYVKSLGLDIIITDHHEPPEAEDDLPNCLIINPMVECNNYPFKYLSGVGVAFKLVKALISKSKLDERDKRKLEKRILDLVAIGTVADCVSLLGENRVLVKQGLEVINEQRRVGLVELIKAAQINGRIDTWNISWQIAPRLNVAGRLEHANTAYELLITKDKNEARVIARRLNDKNIERQKITKEIIEYCIQIIDKKLFNEKILILVDPNLIQGNKLDVRLNKSFWPEGVIGLVAGRLCEQYSRPVLVITQANGEIKGSGRSIDGFNIIEAIEQTAEFFSKFGGHAGACGFSLEDKNSLSGFINKIKKVANDKLKELDLKPKVMIEAELELSEIDEKLVEDLAKFAPFGENNPRPKFVSRDVQIRDIINMGIDAQHVKFRLASSDNFGHSGNPAGRESFWAIAFNQAEQWQHLQIGDKVDIVYYVEKNEFNGRSEVQLKVVDIKKIA